MENDPAYKTWNQNEMATTGPPSLDDDTQAPQLHSQQESRSLIHFKRQKERGRPPNPTYTTRVSGIIHPDSFPHIPHPRHHVRETSTFSRLDNEVVNCMSKDSSTRRIFEMQSNPV